jgi:tRNA threonylcarbamoyl adenosine modification protein YjeE
MERLTTTPEETELLGQELAARLRGGDIVLLRGDLAAGKTTLVRGLVHGLSGDGEEVTSPTFVLVQTYPCAGRGIGVVHHIDLYRLARSSPHALREVGIEELLSESDAVAAVEWPRAEIVGWVPGDARLWEVLLEVLDDDRRRITVTEPEGEG